MQYYYVNHYKWINVFFREDGHLSILRQIISDVIELTTGTNVEQPTILPERSTSTPESQTEKTDQTLSESKMKFPIGKYVLFLK